MSQGLRSFHGQGSMSFIHGNVFLSAFLAAPLNDQGFIPNPIARFLLRSVH